MEKNNFEYYLNKNEEVGYIKKVLGPIVYVDGLPGISQEEMVIFENGSLGRVTGLDSERVEILLFSNSNFRVGTQVARMGLKLQIEVNDSFLGKEINPLGRVVSNLSEKPPTTPPTKGVVMPIDSTPIDLMKRTKITKPFGTGVLLVDMVVPLAMGQRELVLGDINTGKTSFLRQVLINQASRGVVCVYSTIGKKKTSIKRLREFITKSGVSENIILVSSHAVASSGLNFITPYTAMAVAEYFRDQGKDVFVILDDLTTHSKYYREISLLARRFPGRSSYPGDIFYVHSRLLERAGSFEKGTITCLPVAETVMGDLSGYLQTNIMAMTDGHIFFDKNMFDRGKLPPVNQFLSVTRVGLQTQTDLMRDISRILSKFMVSLEKARQFMHFGSELNEEVKKMLALGVRLDEFFNQRPEVRIEANMGAFLLGVLWGGFWVNDPPSKIKKDMMKMIASYQKDPKYKAEVESIVGSVGKLKELVDKIRLSDHLVLREVLEKGVVYRND